MSHFYYTNRYLIEREGIWKPYILSECPPLVCFPSFHLVAPSFLYPLLHITMRGKVEEEEDLKKGFYLKWFRLYLPQCCQRMKKTEKRLDQLG